MTVQQCYEAFGGNYQDVISRLRTNERVARFLLKVVDDGSYKLLCESVEAGNVEDAFRAAHTLKGVCMNLSITRFAESATALTEALRGKTEFGDGLQPLLQRVKEDYDLTVKCILQLDK